MEKYKITYVECGDPKELVHIYGYSDEYTNMEATAVKEFMDSHDMTNIISFRMERIK
jgi:hypothetical protein